MGLCFEGWIKLGANNHDIGLLSCEIAKQALTSKPLGPDLKIFEDLVLEHATALEACSDDDMVSLGSEDYNQGVLTIPSPAGLSSNLQMIGPSLFSPLVFQGTDIP